MSLFSCSGFVLLLHKALGLRTHELVLRITGTSIKELPKGLLRYLADIRYLTLDVRGNLLSSMEPDVLSPAPRIRTDGHTTQHISGGVLLEDNPWVCGCGIVWIGAWIRRWMRETLRVQMLHFEGFLYAQSLARRTLCTLPGGHNSTSTSIPLVDLHPALFGCREDEGALSSSAGRSADVCPWTVLVALVVCWQCSSVIFRWCRCKQRTS
ncbi:hypothetical protein JTE90_010648 [Oedothorax gibbosus]|uniref:Uncharacterized protein n=1 Tax=Oedothorax gibbosus TaxID=931172 RepID=A0AAV6U9A9_9ARAC|nr:hypothetical protein JTE90_010648 [Oedothorax gibbosus]